MTPRYRAATATALAAAVLVGAAAPAGALYEGGLEFAPDNWQEQAPLPGPPERLEDAAQVGQTAAAAKQAAEAAKHAAQKQNDIARHLAEAGEDDAARLAQQGAAAGLTAAVAAAEAAEAAAQAAAPTNLGVAGEAVSVPLEAVQQQAPAEDLLSVSWLEVVGDFPEGEQNTAALSAWQWLRLHGWRGIPGDGEERLYSPEHPRYAETQLVGELPGEVFVWRVLPGSDVTEHVGEVLDAAGWELVDGWLLPPEALPF